MSALIGSRVPRLEDFSLLTGGARFVDDIPADRKAALISAFDATMKDADFLAEAQKLNFDVRPVSAAKIDALLAEVYSTPTDVIDRARKAIASEGQ